MRKIMLTLVFAIAITLSANAQNTNKYAVWFDADKYIECVEFSYPNRDTVALTMLSGEVKVYPLSEVDKITSIPTKTVPEADKSDNDSVAQGIVLEELEPQVEQGSVQDDIVKNTYNQPPHTSRIYTMAPSKSPMAAGVLSFLMPGIGQFYNGDFISGLSFMVGIPVFFSYSFSIAFANRSNAYLLGSIFGTIGLYIWNIVHAVNGADKFNLKRGYVFKDGKTLDFQPTLITTSNSVDRQNYHVGMSLSLRF